MTEKSTRVIKWKDNGPVKNYQVEVPDEGLLVFEGPPGSGKSTMLLSLEEALDPDRKVHIPIRDGAPRAEVEIFGQLVLRRSLKARRIGRLEIATLSGKFTVGDLVEPKFKDPLPRDAHRIKAVLQLTSATVDTSAFYPLVGSQDAFDKYVPPSSLNTTDIVEVAAVVKSYLEQAARALEQEVETLQTKAEAARLAANGTDLEGPHDAKVLSEAHENTIREHSRLKAEAKAYADAETKREESREEMNKLAREYKGLGRPEAFELAERAKSYHETTKSEVERLKEELRKAEGMEISARAAFELADQRLETAQAHAAALAALQRVVDTKLPDQVLEIDLFTAQNDVEIALRAVETGALIRKARADRENALNLKSEAETKGSEAEQLRDAAKATDSVLAEAIQSLGLPLGVRDGRLMITNSDRSPDGYELFEDLSKGEKTKLVIQIAIKAVGPGGMFPIPQEFYEGLTESNIIQIAQELENTGVLAITAKAVDGEGITAKVVEAFPLGT